MQDSHLRSSFGNGAGLNQKCTILTCHSREKFVLTNEHHLKGYMNEFREHKLVKLVNNHKEGTEMYSIQMPTAFISKILSEVKQGALQEA